MKQARSGTPRDKEELKTELIMVAENGVNEFLEKVGLPSRISFNMVDKYRELQKTEPEQQNIRKGADSILREQLGYDSFEKEYKRNNQNPVAQEILKGNAQESLDEQAWQVINSCVRPLNNWSL
jgi:hypothetical protein